MPEWKLVDRPIGIADKKIFIVSRDCHLIVSLAYGRFANVVNPAVRLYDFPLSDVNFFLMSTRICEVQLGFIAGCNHGIDFLRQVMIFAPLVYETTVLCYHFSVFDRPLEHRAVPAEELGIWIDSFDLLQASTWSSIFLHLILFWFNWSDLNFLWGKISWSWVH